VTGWTAKGPGEASPQAEGNPRSPNGQSEDSRLEMQAGAGPCVGGPRENTGR